MEIQADQEKAETSSTDTDNTDNTDNTGTQRQITGTGEREGEAEGAGGWDSLHRKLNVVFSDSMKERYFDDVTPSVNNRETRIPSKMFGYQRKDVGARITIVTKFHQALSHRDSNLKLQKIIIKLTGISNSQPSKNSAALSVRESVVWTKFEKARSQRSDKLIQFRFLKIKWNTDGTNVFMQPL
ncbi:hypothetical protein WN51_05713 [Melipona quadrifasciata]|uniref:Uncharacterized protein n=1 Tax=Melipona quadrifasciata TaxID=166423 RepID=A0A0M9A5T8_9HYME|nr:hypothetical protein WN51_05713 [Melipona quadrifasciata]